MENRSSETKVSGAEKVFVRLSISPDFDTQEPNWICDAMAAITLKSTQPDLESITKNIPRTEFNGNVRSSAAISFIKLSELKTFSRNQRVFFYVHLWTNPMKVRNAPLMEQSRLVFRYTLQDASKLKVHFVPEFTLQESKWCIMFRKAANNIGVFLCDKRGSKNKNWTYFVKASFTLLSFDEGVDGLTRKIERRFYVNDENWGFCQFLEWKSFMDPNAGYVKNDCAVFQIDLDIESPQPRWGIEDKTATDLGQAFQCSICLQKINGREPTATKCGHLFCSNCIRRSITTRPKCPNCNAAALLSELRSIFL